MPVFVLVTSSRPIWRPANAAGLVRGGWQPSQRPCRQLGDASIASKRRYNDDAIVLGGAFEHYAAVLAWIKRP
jgi:hypothetical protein